MTSKFKIGDHLTAITCVFWLVVIDLTIVSGKHVANYIQQKKPHVHDAGYFNTHVTKLTPESYLGKGYIHVETTHGCKYTLEADHFVHGVKHARRWRFQDRPGGLTPYATIVPVSTHYRNLDLRGSSRVEEVPSIFRSKYQTLCDDHRAWPKGFACA